MNVVRAINCCVILALAAAASDVNSTGQERLDPVKWSIGIESPEMARKPGEKVNIELGAKIDDGWHLYAPEQPAGGPIPTRIDVPEDQPFRLSGRIETPLPRIELDPNFNLDTQFYEEEAIFNIPVEILADAPAGRQEIRVHVLYQTCNWEKCLPPKRLKLAAVVEIAAHSK
jgi:DsbC/DsbD-like thiol-disulfide interchange protein